MNKIKVMILTTMMSAGMSVSADTWTTVGQGSMTEPCFSYLFDRPSPTYNVTVQKSEQTPGLYQVVEAFGNSNPNFKSIKSLIGAYTPTNITVDVSNPDAVTIAYQPIGWVDDIDTYYILSKNPGKLKDGTVTFAKGDVCCAYEGLYGNGAFRCDNTVAFSLTLPDLLAVQPPQPTSLSPADGSRLSSFSGVDITFDKTIASADVSGISFCKEQQSDNNLCSRWTADITANGVRLTPKSPVMLFPDEDYDVFYYLNIPAGAFVADDGTANNAFTVQYIALSNPMNIVSVVPASNSELRTFSSFTVASDEATVFSETIYPTFTKGSADGENLLKNWSATRIDASTIMYSASFSVSLEPGVEYFLTLPYAMLMGSSSGTKNHDTVIRYVGYDAASIDATETAKTPDGKYADGRKIVVRKNGKAFTTAGIPVK